MSDLGRVADAPEMAVGKTIDSEDLLTHPATETHPTLVDFLIHEIVHHAPQGETPHA